MGRGDVEKPGPGYDTRDYTAAQAVLQQGQEFNNDEQLQRVIDERTAEWHAVIE
jgi:hypothetical protein